jgi:hypothetical protein
MSKGEDIMRISVCKAKGGGASYLKQEPHAVMRFDDVCDLQL